MWAVVIGIAVLLAASVGCYVIVGDTSAEHAREVRRLDVRWKRGLVED